ncbi:WecB/TagA/CpsF family glycosyltransferase [Acetobacter fallax]|uniref:WecB/TagA/CpsF family glycosyltransferase n=1 Tax=Acetobacter fallax TaxID=1737473 RepID=A0ABX0K941_9PROT|nr:WecB/TagA/CpsF family glycosyltransferase [Acetobacter fallax]NHO32318.1 WecB/TagA/CpsF family glycosyltransferase [Acetobacter fallax]NHO35878.1 WecB/TagA/CpsF family glycosyltransferase [Acetobacter fallax]
MPSDHVKNKKSELHKAYFAGREFSVVSVMGVRLFDISREDLEFGLISAIREGQKLRVINANAHCLTIAQRLPWLRELFQKAEVAFCDGAGVQLASLFLTGRRLHRTTPPEWVGNVLQELGSEASVYWLGGDEVVVAEAAKAFAGRYGCRIAGWHNGFFDADPESVDSQAILAEIKQTCPSVLLLNMGMPRQERWLWDNWEKLPPVVAITAGALVDHAAGRVRRPPRWVANLGLEWLVRLSREPRRLWRRYIIGLPVFGFYVLRSKIITTLRKSGGCR